MLRAPRQRAGSILPDPGQQRGELIERPIGYRWSPAGTAEPLLLTSEVAVLFRVTERTVGAWTRDGRLPSVRTPGGRRRYPAQQILRLLGVGPA